MKTILSIRIFLIVLLLIYTKIAVSQTGKVNLEQMQEYIAEGSVSHYNINQTLGLAPSKDKINHVFRITMSEKEYKRLSKSHIDKDYLSECYITYNDDTLDLRELELRGKSSMSFKRKSFSVKLNEKATFSKKGITKKLKKINLISLSMDKNYYRNKVAFDLMDTLGIFNLFYDYAEVIVNEKSQGIYLIVQKPKNYAFKKEDAEFMLRRDFEHVINKTYHKGDDSISNVKYEKAFVKIYEEIIKKEGKTFYDELSKLLDVEQYFTWMAFNYLIGNQDYTDEVFFYNKSEDESIKFGIIPWDYDDIFSEFPREGYLVRYINFGDKLAFSSEDDLDYKIVKDDYTYNKYLEVLAKVTNKLSVDLLKEVFDQTYQELYPFYCNKDILKVSKYDEYGKTDLSNLEMDMQENFLKIAQKREETANFLAPNFTQINK